VLLRRLPATLPGRRIGLITNHTGLNLDGQAGADLLRAAAGVRLSALFGPEHGIRGAVDQTVPDGVDAATGLPVYSLYGDRVRPTPEQLRDVDLLVYDIQDVGARFYTYISTLGYCLEAAADAGLLFLVLDRPNPLGGRAVEGPIADPDLLSFTAYHPIPVRHGLTVGELARLFVAEKRLKVSLDVVKAEGWRRDDLWDATGLTWTNPSPNMRSLTQAMLYPGIALLEFTNVSVGRGTDTPFEVVGAPWIDGRELAAELNASGLPGVRFVPIRFTPRERQHAGTPCGGVNVVITCWREFMPVRAGLAIAQALRHLYPQSWDVTNYNRLLANRRAYDALIAGADATELTHSFKADIEAFRSRAAPHLLYS
jgi:uncharacterized protein YbbC (DUF1343 family)